MDSSVNKLNESHDTPTKKRKVFDDKEADNLDEQAALNLPNDSDRLQSSAEENSGDGIKAVNEDDVGFSSTPDTKEFASTPDHPSRSSSPASVASESDWQPPTNGAIDWIYSQIMNDRNPRDVITHLMPNIPSIPSHLSDWDVWRVLIRMLSEPPRRTKLPHVNTFNHVIELIKRSKKIMVLTGAGVSVSCGIPDFRSRDGVYARLAVDFPDLPNPEAMFSINYFQHDPRPFFKFAKEIYPGQFKPSLVHRFISSLEEQDKLLRNYTQNIDTLEQVAGISRVVQCHGSFSHATCQVCKHQVTGEEIREDVFKQVVPICPRCPPGDGAGILKPDIVFFGENLPEHFHRQMTADKDEADLLIVVGSALKVRPVALIPNSLPEEVPQILINREPLPHMGFDVELLGDADGVVAHICRALGPEYEEIYGEKESLSEITSLPDDTSPCDDVATNGDANDNVIAMEQKSSSNNDVSSVPSSSDAANAAATSSAVASSNGSGDTMGDQSEGPTSDDLKGMWQSRWKQSISRKIPAGSYYFDGGHRYIFPGAEIPPEEDSSSDDDSSDEDPATSESSPIVRPQTHLDPSTSSDTPRPDDPTSTDDTPQSPEGSTPPGS